MKLINYLTIESEILMFQLIISRSRPSDNKNKCKIFTGFIPMEKSRMKSSIKR